MGSPPSTHAFLLDGPDDAANTLILAHGAGAAMDSEFMNTLARGMAEHDLHVVRFEFPYMAQRRLTGKRRPPDKEPILRQTWLEVIDGVASAGRLFIGGKSMGGRIASLVADEAGVAGLIVLGYPFHPAGKPEKPPVEHLKSLATPTLVLQGERDAFGSQAEVAGYCLSPRIQMHWLADGDHSFKPRRASGQTQQQNWQDAVEVAVRFIRTV